MLEAIETYSITIPAYSEVAFVRSADHSYFNPSKLSSMCRIKLYNTAVALPPSLGFHSQFHGFASIKLFLRTTLKIIEELSF